MLAGPFLALKTATAAAVIAAARSRPKIRTAKSAGLGALCHRADKWSHSVPVAEAVPALHSRLAALAM